MFFTILIKLIVLVYLTSFGSFVSAGSTKYFYNGTKLYNLCRSGNATDEDLLVEEGISNIDMFCSVTDSDEANVMSSLLAKKLGAQKVLSLLNKQSFIDLITQGEVDVTVIPNEITIGVVLQNITKARIARAHTFKRGKSEAVELIATEETTKTLINKHRIRDLEVQYEFQKLCKLLPE